MLDTLSPYYDGASQPPQDVRDELELHAPATGEPYVRVPLCGEGDVNAAVASAKAAFPAWRDTPVVERARVLHRYRALLETEGESIVELICLDHGKVLSDARGELLRGMEVVEFAAGMPALLQGETVQDVARGIDCTAVREPLGVCVGITPFNFPAMVPMWMFPVAIAAGNTFVLKPSEQVPRAALRLAELFRQAGLPEGVFNVVMGGRDASEALIRHPDVRAVSFVGSEPVARSIYRLAGEAGKRVQALSGAKNHLVVMPDANLQRTVDGIMGAAYGSAGERCMAVSAVVTVGAAGDRVVDAVGEAARKLRVGDGLHPESEMGPLISAKHKDRVLGYIDTGEREGAEVVVDGRRHSLVDQPGHFVGPTLLDRVTPEMTVYRDEVFGPVLDVLRTDSLDEAIALVNANPYGNGAAIFTGSGGAARTFRHEVTAGMVGVNVSVPVPLAFFPFAGWKHSFFGDLHVHGRDGVRFYTEIRVVTARWFAEDDGTGRNMTISLG